MALAGRLAGFLVTHLVFGVGNVSRKPHGATVEYLQGKFFRAGQKTGGNDPLMWRGSLYSAHANVKSTWLSFCSQLKSRCA